MAGGVRAYAPISVTIDAGATNLSCILLSPPAEAKPDSTSDFNRFEEVLMRTIDILTEEVGENDVRIAMGRNMEYGAECARRQIGALIV